MSETEFLCDKWWDFERAKSDFEDKLIEAGLEDWSDMFTDPYDASLEIKGVNDDFRFPPTLLDVVWSAGFAKLYVTHKDGWETHYPSGWRRRYVSDPTAKTTNVIAGPPNPGYFEISYMPDGFPKEWLKTGYMRIVPDPVASPTPSHSIEGER